MYARGVRRLLVSSLAACGRLGFSGRVGSDAAPPDAAVLDAALPAGLIHHWQLDEAPGATVAIDAVAGANATVMPPATFVTNGQRGGALYSAAGGFASVPATPSDMLGRAQLTVSGWFRRAGPSMIEQIGQELTPGHDTISLQLWSDGLTYFCMGSPGACGTTAVTNDSNWHFVAMVFDGTQPTDATKLVGYIDGIAYTLSWQYTLPVATSSPTLSGRFDLGATTDNEGDDTGTVDDVRVYDRALDAVEIMTLFVST